MKEEDKTIKILSPEELKKLEKRKEEIKLQNEKDKKYREKMMWRNEDSVFAYWDQPLILWRTIKVKWLKLGRKCYKCGERLGLVYSMRKNEFGIEKPICEECDKKEIIKDNEKRKELEELLNKPNSKPFLKVISPFKICSRNLKISSPLTLK